MRKALVAAAVSFVAIAALAGCVGHDPVVTLPPSPTTTPVFASDEEALAAAEAAYGEYLRVSDEILIDGGANPERLKPFVTDAFYEDELVGFRQAIEKGWHSTGGTKVVNWTLQSFSPSDLRSVVIYLCSDVSAVDVLDSNGVSVVSANRPTQTAFEVGFVSGHKTTAALLVADKTVWDGGGVCG